MNTSYYIYTTCSLTTSAQNVTEIRFITVYYYKIIILACTSAYKKIDSDILSFSLG